MAVYKEAGFPPPAQDILYKDVDFLADIRQDVIRERTGQRVVGTWAVMETPEQILTSTGFDHTMQASLYKSGRTTNLALFMAHAYMAQRNAYSPLMKPTLEGFYNRALLAMNEDIASIDAAIAAVTGKRLGKA